MTDVLYWLKARSYFKNQKLEAKQPIQSNTPSAESIAGRLKRPSKPVIEKELGKEVRPKLKIIRKSQQQRLPIMKSIEYDEFTDVLKSMKLQKVTGFDKLYLQFVKI